MKMILLADTSQTRRRALSAALSNAGFGVTAVEGLAEAYEALMRARIGHGNLDAVVLGWPEYSEGVAEDVFGLLHGERFEHLPVLVMADSSNANAVNWRMSRPRTALDVLVGIPRSTERDRPSAATGPEHRASPQRA